MCHRQLLFTKALRCGHSIYSREVVVDCLSRHCRLSTAHPPTCQRCTCRRYYGQPERLVTHEPRFTHSVRNAHDEVQTAFPAMQTLLLRNTVSLSIYIATVTNLRYFLGPFECDAT
ncbi:hypothetical protein FB451DRAFT_739113 [Mycena latifolia]|nr:hypothetical protein FB451DRAFT_739113 [Mycena latifolia]